MTTTTATPTITSTGTSTGTFTTKTGGRRVRLALAVAVALGFGATACGTRVGASNNTTPSKAPGYSTDHDSRIVEAPTSSGNQDGHGTRAGSSHP